jgi:hypothetical protein
VFGLDRNSIPHTIYQRRKDEIRQCWEKDLETGKKKPRTYNGKFVVVF